MTSKISVIVPVYNTAAYFRETLASLDKQTLSKSDYEVIIVDDCSSDDSLAIAKSWRHGRDNVVILKNSKNSGIAFSRNRAIDVASSSHIAVLDSDDTLTSNALEKSLDFFSNNPEVKYSYSMHNSMDKYGNFIIERPSQEFSMDDLFHYNFISPLKCFEKDLHKDIGGFSSGLPCAEDWDHALRAAIELEGEGIKRNKEVFYNYRWHAANTSSSKVSQIKKTISQFLSSHLKSTGINVKKVWYNPYSDSGYSYYDWST